VTSTSTNHSELLRSSRDFSRPTSFCVSAGLLALLGLCFASSARAQAPAGGSIAGHVLNVSTGEYLDKALVEIAGTSQETLTNSYGEYRLENVPAGSVVLKMFYTGLPDQSMTVVVQSGQVAKADFDYKSEIGETIKLSNVVVEENKETDPFAIAVNEQRFAPSISTVAAANEFGDQNEGNVGEFIKWLPGVNLDYASADAQRVELNGFPTNVTVVTIDGNRIASTNNDVTSRTFAFDQVSMNNIGRVELTEVPTPDVPADAMGGRVNLVSKSALDYSHLEVDYSLWGSMNSYKDTLEETPGPNDGESYKVRPGFDFTVVDPLNKNFGITFTALQSHQYDPEDKEASRWSPTGVGMAAPGFTTTAADPVMTQWFDFYGNRFIDRSSYSLGANWRFSPTDILTFNTQLSLYTALTMDYLFKFVTGTDTAASGGNFTYGNPGKGTVTEGMSNLTIGGATFLPSVEWQHFGSVWTMDAGAYYSRSYASERSSDQGYPASPTFTIPGVTIDFSGISFQRPEGITVTTAAGAPVNFNSLSSYNLSGISYDDEITVDYFRGAHTSASRVIDLGVPITVKVGADVRAEHRDIQNTPESFSPTVTINGAQFLSSAYSAVKPPYGIIPSQLFDPYQLQSFFNSNQSDFAENLAGSGGAVASAATNSQSLNETIPAYYIRADTHLLDNRLWIVGGVRFEATEDSGQGLLDNPNAIYVPGTKTVITTNTVTQAQEVYQARGFYNSANYSGSYPSLNTTFNITDNLLFRAGYATTIARPDLPNIIPGFTITAPSTSVPDGAITVSNTHLEPWTSRGYDGRLEYYSKSGGVLSVGGFYDTISNFFGSTTYIQATASQLATLGVSSAYAGYDTTTTFNSGTALVSGAQANFVQGLGFLNSDFLSDFKVFASYTSLDLKGAEDANFSGFVPKVVNWGITYEKPKKYLASIKWNYRGTERQGEASTSMAPGTFSYLGARMIVDLNLEYTINHWVRLFADCSNMFNSPLINETYALQTPAYARNFGYNNFGAQWTIGIKGSF